LQKTHSGDPGTKPLSYYEKYDEFLNRHKIEPASILEIGTYEGESTKIFSQRFPDAKILTVDLDTSLANFDNFNNIFYEKIDQTDSFKFKNLIESSFPLGISLVVEDASHFGYFSHLTFKIVFPHLREGGAYFVEDWGTGYWDSWPDGSRYQEFDILTEVKNLPKRIPSHDFGMVGFVKSLVDLTHESAIKVNQNDPSSRKSRLRTLEFGEGVCLMVKN
jgi:hypothetical protein